ncbi:hypothetical protein C7M84_022122 [Penaeus vannamei]|uniref:Uncharacterized protein n=1 Tax=Penaeus vannamei TaxID=6689 RepID=A0A423U7S9_PENVA|nr:hypothetical protein C7M84_022122 [Penaeus vannamei]
MPSGGSISSHLAPPSTQVFREAGKNQERPSVECDQPPGLDQLLRRDARASLVQTRRGLLVPVRAQGRRTLAVRALAAHTSRDAPTSLVCVPRSSADGSACAGASALSLRVRVPSCRPWRVILRTTFVTSPTCHRSRPRASLNTPEHARPRPDAFPAPAPRRAAPTRLSDTASRMTVAVAASLTDLPLSLALLLGMDDTTDAPMRHPRPPSPPPTVFAPYTPPLSPRPTPRSPRPSPRTSPSQHKVSLRVPSTSSPRVRPPRGVALVGGRVPGPRPHALAQPLRVPRHPRALPPPTATPEATHSGHPHGAASATAADSPFAAAPPTRPAARPPAQGLVLLGRAGRALHAVPRRRAGPVRLAQHHGRHRVPGGLGGGRPAAGMAGLQHAHGLPGPGRLLRRVGVAPQSSVPQEPWPLPPPYELALSPASREVAQGLLLQGASAPGAAARPRAPLSPDRRSADPLPRGDFPPRSPLAPPRVPPRRPPRRATPLAAAGAAAGRAAAAGGPAGA